MITHSAPRIGEGIVVSLSPTLTAVLESVAERAWLVYDAYGLPLYDYAFSADDRAQLADALAEYLLSVMG